jgi:hypothetical protein
VRVVVVVFVMRNQQQGPMLDGGDEVMIDERVENN